MIDLVEKAFLQAIENTRRRDECNLKFQVNMKLMDLIEGSVLFSKGLVVTGGQDPEQGPWFTAVDLW